MKVRGQPTIIDARLMEKKIKYVLKSTSYMPAAKNCYEGDGVGTGADKIEGMLKKINDWL